MLSKNFPVDSSILCAVKLLSIIGSHQAFKSPHNSSFMCGNERLFKIKNGPEAKPSSLYLLHKQVYFGSLWGLSIALKQHLFWSYNDRLIPDRSKGQYVVH